MSDYIRPATLIAHLTDSAVVKAALGPRDLLVRGALSGAILGCVTTVSFAAGLAAGPLAGALLFPAGFAIITILALELLTGSFGMVPLAALEGRIGPGRVLANWGWVLAGNLAGSLAYACLFWVSQTGMGHDFAGPLADRIRFVAEHKVLPYQAHGFDGLVTVFVRGVLCNWMVCLAVVMGAASTSAAGKILGCWLPITIFVLLGFEHSVVNMFAIPLGIMMGAHVTWGGWWAWNEIPVLLGNMVGGLAFTFGALWLTYRGGERAPAAPLGEVATVGRSAAR